MPHVLAVCNACMSMAITSAHACSRAANDATGIPIVFMAIQLLGIWSRYYHDNLQWSRNQGEGTKGDHCPPPPPKRFGHNVHVLFIMNIIYNLIQA